MNTRFKLMVSTFFSFGGAGERKMCPLRHPGLAKDTKSYPKWRPGASKMHPKSDLEAIQAPRVPPEVSGVPPDGKTCKKTLQLTWEVPSCSKKWGSRFLEVGLQKISLEMHLTLNFTCSSFPVKPKKTTSKEHGHGGHGFCQGKLHSETLLARI